MHLNYGVPKYWGLEEDVGNSITVWAFIGLIKEKRSSEKRVLAPNLHIEYH